MSVEDDVRAAVEQHNKPEPVVEAVEPVEAEPVEAQEESAKPGRTANRLRDENGRLLPGKKEEPIAAAESAPTTQVAPEGAETPAAAPIPNSLKAQFKAQWGNLSPEWRAEIIRIDQAGIKGSEHLRSAAKFGDEVLNVVKPYEQLIASEGGTPAAAIADLLKTAALFRQGSQEQKQQALMQIARQYGVQLPQASVDPALLQPGAQVPQFDPLAHPVIKTLQERTQRYEQLLQQQEQMEMQGNQTVVDAFLSAVDAQGNALHPIDESMHDAFAQEIGAVKTAHPEMGKQQILEKAYENLSWKMPEIREVMLARRDAEAEAKRKAEIQKSLKDKKHASGSLTGAPTTAGAVTGGSIRDIVAAQVMGAGRI